MTSMRLRGLIVLAVMSDGTDEPAVEVFVARDLRSTSRYRGTVRGVPAVIREVVWALQTIARVIERQNHDADVTAQ